MMAHWGLYSLIGGEWKGRRMDSRYIGEWARAIDAPPPFVLSFQLFEGGDIL